MSVTYSLIVGPLALSIVFFLCLFLVYGIKTFIGLFTKKPTPTKKIHKPQRKKIRSIEINPEDVDRIYVRKP